LFLKSFIIRKKVAGIICQSCDKWMASGVLNLYSDRICPAINAFATSAFFMAIGLINTLVNVSTEVINEKFPMACALKIVDPHHSTMDFAQ
jgi:hypothetical protein